MPPTLGQRLKHAREKRGLSLRDVEHTTKIPVPRLQDLEDDKLNTFGGMTYAKAFLRTYSGILEVNADDVLGHMQAPPLGGVRDYRYLVESHGPWVPDRSERHQGGPALPTVAPGKSFAFAAMMCLAFGLLIGGGVLANAYFHSKPSPTADSSGVAGAAPVISGGALAEASSLSSDAFLPPDENSEEREFTLFGVSLTLVPEKGAATPVWVPKAQAVPPEPASAAVVPPKAEAVR